MQGQNLPAGEAQVGSWEQGLLGTEWLRICQQHCVQAAEGDREEWKSIFTVE